MRTILFFLFITITNVAFADALGMRISGGSWNYGISGVMRDSPNVSDGFNLKSDLGMEDDSVFNGFVYIEHPVPLLPNVRLGRTNLDLSGNGTLAGGKTWAGTTIPAGDVYSDINLSHTEIGLYYEIMDTGFDFDLGLNVKLFDGDVRISDNGLNTAASDFNQNIPMLYGHFGVPLPMGFGLSGDVSYAGLNGDTFSDIMVSVSWTYGSTIGVEVGHRNFKIDYEDGDKVADIKIEGPFVNARLTF